MLSTDAVVTISGPTQPKTNGRPKGTTATCPACLGKISTRSREGLCDGCAMILEAWQRAHCPATPEHLAELCAKGRATWGPDTPMWRWPLFWWRHNR